MGGASAVRFAAGLGAILVGAIGIALVVRERVRSAPGRRIRALVLGAIALAAAVALFAALPRYASATSGSPSRLVFQIAIWLFCVVLGVAGAASIAGAALAGSSHEGDGRRG